jgi:hypothetical protein
VATLEGATGVRASNRNGFRAGDQVVVGFGTPNAETRTITAVAVTNPPSPNPNVTLDAPLAFAHAVGEALHGGVLQAQVGFQPDYATEGKFETLEFSAGNFGLLESAFEYEKDKVPPRVKLTVGGFNRGPIYTTFQFINEPSVIRYTLDGSRPDMNSTLWDSSGPREPGQVFYVTSTTTFRWLATDIKGNQTYGTSVITIGNP